VRRPIQPGHATWVEAGVDVPSAALECVVGEGQPLTRVEPGDEIVARELEMPHQERRVVRTYVTPGVPDPEDGFVGLGVEIDPPIEEGDQPGMSKAFTVVVPATFAVNS